MNKIYQKKQDENKNTINSVIAGVAGAAAIAGAAVGAAMALKDEKTREKVRKVLISVKDQAINYVETLKIEPDIQEAVRTIKKTAEETKKVVEKNI